MQDICNKYVVEKTTTKQLGKDLIQCVYNAYSNRNSQSKAVHKIGVLCINTNTFTNGKQDAYILNEKMFSIAFDLALLAHQERMNDMCNAKSIPQDMFEDMLIPFICNVNMLQEKENYIKKLVSVQFLTANENDEIVGEEPIMTIESDEEISEGRVC